MKNRESPRLYQPFKTRTLFDHFIKAGRMEGEKCSDLQSLTVLFTKVYQGCTLVQQQKMSVNSLV